MADEIAKFEQKVIKRLSSMKDADKTVKRSIQRNLQALRDGIRYKFYNRDKDDYGSNNGGAFRRNKGRLYNAWSYTDVVETRMGQSNAFTGSVFAYTPKGKLSLTRPDEVSIYPAAGRKFLLAPNTKVKRRVNPSKAVILRMFSEPRGKNKNVWGVLGASKKAKTAHWFLVDKLTLPRQPRGLQQYINEKSDILSNRLASTIVERFGEGKAGFNGSRATIADRFL